MSDAVGGRGIRCQIGRTSLRSCFTGRGVAQSFFVGNTKKRASSPGCCGWCGDTFQPELVACSRAAQLLDESLGTLHGGWVQSDQILFHQAPAAILWRGGDILPSRLEEVSPAPPWTYPGTKGEAHRDVDKESGTHCCRNGIAGHVLAARPHHSGSWPSRT